jgi:nucleotide-binding universal stress UspA family protein
MRITKVLVPVDFSPPSIMAVNYGVSLARQFRAQLLLLHILGTADTRENREQAACALSMLVSPEDQDDLNLLVLVRPGGIKEEIEAAVTENGADAIVMGTHGRRLLGRLLIGSVTEALLRKLTIPLMTVCHTTRPLEFKCLLFATDLSDNSEKAFLDVVDLARTLSASVLVTHVASPLVELYEGPEVISIAERARREYRKEIQERVERLASTARREGISCEAVLIEGDPHVAILEQAEERSADLIVVGVAERGAIDRALFGSTAEAVIRDARIPVLSLHIPKAKIETEEETQIVGHWARA